MDKINFNENYNNKLNCTYYTTIRKKNYEKYKIGNVYQITLNDKFLHKSVLVGIKYIDINIKNSPDFYIELDTGMNEPDFSKLFEELGLDGYCMILLLRKINE